MRTGNYVLADMGGAHYWLGGRFVPVEQWEDMAEHIVRFASGEEAAATVCRLREQGHHLKVVLSPWVSAPEDGPAGFVLTDAAGTHYRLAEGWIRVEDWELLADEIVRFRSWAAAAAALRTQAASGVSLKVALSPWPCVGRPTNMNQQMQWAGPASVVPLRRTHWRASPQA
jgi:hypothetical protein